MTICPCSRAWLLQLAFAHRTANDPSLPSLGRLYRLFPAGWRSVLKQAERRA
jgi:hypothetical protein